jgi:hypothetical protein
MVKDTVWCFKKNRLRINANACDDPNMDLSLFSSYTIQWHPLIN